jgi:hypothetical protein
MNGDAVFWYFDANGRVCKDKIVRYGLDGHRDKSFGGYSRFRTRDGYTERPYFGSNLVGEGDAVKVVVVESEKSALLLALETGWTVLATGGKNALKKVDADVELYPDMDAIEEWKKKGKVAEWWKDWDEVGEKSDIGDLIVERMKFRLKGGKRNEV